MAKRPVFQEMSTAAPATAVPPGSLIDAAPRGARRAPCAGLVRLVRENSDFLEFLLRFCSMWE